MTEKAKGQREKKPYKGHKWRVNFIKSISLRKGS
jgi:hypothetical protein